MEIHKIKNRPNESVSRNIKTVKLLPHNITPQRIRFSRPLNMIWKACNLFYMSPVGSPQCHKTAVCEWVFLTIGREFCHASREEVTKMNRKLNQEDILSIILSEGI